MAEKQSIKRFIVRDPHGHIEQEDSFSVVGEVHVDIVPGYGEPYAESEYVNGTLTITIHNIEGNGITEITTDSQEGDEAVNTVTIKTNANPEGVVLEVRNGSRGNGIVSTSEVLSPEDGGTNTHTFIDTDGNEHVFHTKNGQTGKKGDQGDSAVYDPDDPDAPDFVMANTTGQSTTKAMTQKAVSDVVNNFSIPCSGGNDVTRQPFYHLVKGRFYRINVLNVWNVTTVTYGKLNIYVKSVVDNTLIMTVVTVPKATALQRVYTFTAPDADGYLSIEVRGDAGEKANIVLESVDTFATGEDVNNVGLTQNLEYNSSKLPTSSTVFKELFNSPNIHEGKYINSNDVFVDSNDWFVEEYALQEPIAEGDEIVWNGITNNANACLLIINGTTKRGWSANGDSRTITIPAGIDIMGGDTIKASFLKSKRDNAYVTINGVKLQSLAVPKWSEINNVKEDLAELKQNVKKVLYNTVKYSNVTVGKGLLHDGVFSSNRLGITSNIPVSNGDIITVNCGNVQAVSGRDTEMVLYDAQGSVLNYWTITANRDNITINNENASYIRVTVALEFYDKVNVKVNGVTVWEPEWVYAYDDIQGELDSLQSEIDSLSPESDLINYRYGALKENTIVETDIYGYTDYIPVSNSDVVDLKYGINNSGLYIIAYDSNKNILSRWSCVNNARTITIPSTGDYAYIRMSFRIGYEASVKINDEDVWLGKEPNNTTVSGQHILKIEQENQSVATYNADKQPMITSLSRSRNGISPVKYFVIAQISDTHGDNNLVKRATDFLNDAAFSSVDCLIHTGDIQYYQFAPDSQFPKESEIAVAFDQAMNIRYTKPAYTCIGNHDVYKSTTKAELYNRFMKPMVDLGRLTLNTNIHTNETWYYIDYTGYKIRLIVLNDFDPLYDGYTKPLNTTAYSPEQIQFLINKLSDVPSDYTVIVASHFLPTKGEGYTGYVIDSDWNEKAEGSVFATTQESVFTDNANPVVDILSAYKSKTTLNKTFTYKNSAVQQQLGSIEVDVDFSNADGDFAFVLNGHAHFDIIHTFSGYNNIIVSGCAGGLTATRTDSNTKVFRDSYGKSQDAINVYCVRTDIQKVYVIRFGADYRCDGIEHKMTSFDY